MTEQEIVDLAHQHNAFVIQQGVASATAEWLITFANAVIAAHEASNPTWNSDVLRVALEALELALPYRDSVGALDKHTSAIEKIKEVLHADS